VALFRYQLICGNTAAAEDVIEGIAGRFWYRQGRQPGQQS
jgi:hypothetical protein